MKKQRNRIPEQELQTKFKNCGLLVIDEKSLFGQRTLILIDKHLRAARPQKQDQIFGGLSIILLGDWKQLAPIGDKSLYSRSATSAAGFNLYREFKDTIFFNRIQRQEGEEN